MALYPSPNITPPCSGYPISLVFSARNLLDLDITSLSDPFLILSQYLPESNSWHRVGCTETISDCLNPSWEKTIQVFYYPPPLLTSPLPYFPPPCSREAEIVKPTNLSELPRSPEERMRRLSTTSNAPSINTPISIVPVDAITSTVNHPHKKSALGQPANTLTTPVSYLDYRIEIYDRDHDNLLDLSKHDFLGRYHFNLQTLMETHDHQIDAKLFTAPTSPSSTPQHCKSGTVRVQAFPLYSPFQYALCTCRIEQMKGPKTFLQLQFLQIDTFNHSHIIYASEIQQSVEDPEFIPFRLNTTMLCQDDPAQAFLIRVVTHENPQYTKILSEVRITLKEIVVNHGQPPKWQNMYNYHPPSSSNAPTQSPLDEASKFGTLIIEECDLDYNFTLKQFLDQNLVDFNVSVAVDFSSSPDASKIESVHRMGAEYLRGLRKDSVTLNGATIFNTKKKNLFNDADRIDPTPTQPLSTVEPDDYFMVCGKQSNVVFKALQLVAEIFSPLLVSTIPSSSSYPLTSSPQDPSPPVKGIRTIALTGDAEIDTTLPSLSLLSSNTRSYSVLDLFHQYSVACQSPALIPTQNTPFQSLISQISNSLKTPPRFNHKPVACFQRYNASPGSQSNQSPTKSNQSPTESNNFNAPHRPPQTPSTPPALKYEILIILTPLDSISTLTTKAKEELIKTLHTSSKLPLSIIFVLLDEFNNPAGLDFINAALEAPNLSEKTTFVSKIFKRSQSDDWSTDDIAESHLTRQHTQIVPMYSFPLADTLSLKYGQTGPNSKLGSPNQPEQTPSKVFYCSPVAAQAFHKALEMNAIPAQAQTPSPLQLQSQPQPIIHPVPPRTPTSARPCIVLPPPTRPQSQSFSQSPDSQPLFTRFSTYQHSAQDTSTSDSASLNPSSTSQSQPDFSGELSRSVLTNDSAADPTTLLRPSRPQSARSQHHQHRTAIIPPPAPTRQAPTRPTFAPPNAQPLSHHAPTYHDQGPPATSPTTTTLPTILDEPGFSPKPTTESATFNPNTIRMHPSIDVEEPNLMALEHRPALSHNYFTPRFAQSPPTITPASPDPPTTPHRNTRATMQQHGTQTRPRRRSSVTRPVHIVDPWDALIQKYSGTIFTQLQVQVLEYLAGHRMWPQPDNL